MEAPVPGNAFEWEREWRVPHDFTFDARHIQFMTAPEEQHDDMRIYFRERATNPGFPNVVWCPLIDLNWDRDRIRQELRPW
ncbi:hypothetical protein CDO31_29280 (plasmid) [Sinorhizobium meliloti]|nr:hypothetical protein CDO31_29280 [Sinorhizobium meliloti]